MNARRAPVRNQRRSGPRQRRGQNLLEVTVRSRLASRQRNRRVLAIICQVVMIGGILAATIYGVKEGVRRFIFENPEYRLAVVEINDESTGISRDTVLTTAGLRIGDNIFRVHLEQAREAIAALPQVERVELQRVLPNKVTIDIVERRPVAWVADGHSDDPSASEKSFLIDSKRILFKPKVHLPEYLRLPSIYGVATENFLPGDTVDIPEVRSALELIQQNGDTSRFQLESIDLSKGYCMVVTDAKRAQITFGIDNVEGQLDRLGAVLDYVAGVHRELQTVNLMVERNVPVTFVPPTQASETSGSAGASSATAAEGKGEDDEENTPAVHPSSKTVAASGKAAAISERIPSKASRAALSREAAAFLATRKKGADSSDRDSDNVKKPGKKATPPETAHRTKKTGEPEVRRAQPAIRRALPVNSENPLAAANAD